MAGDIQEPFRLSFQPDDEHDFDTANDWGIIREHVRIEEACPEVGENSPKSPDGDIIDCIHISHQPAFDHPFLKDHKIQMRPSYHPDGLYNANKVSAGPKERTNTITQLWHMNRRCSEKTIPVRRTKKDDVLRASSVKRLGEVTEWSDKSPINVAVTVDAPAVVNQLGQGGCHS